ncbi:MAG: DEAD/DEAH box helicase [Methylococcaceae bacterium]|nr:DEAD/DEAH box helicase [Methylococcaceae bacterium]MCI0732712.1 DEAD/DEAH box helicase [Methylococcaceae bacterium]
MTLFGYGNPMSTEQFHPAVSTWFNQNFRSPSPCQEQAWPAIARGRHSLIAAPTGSGKTLAAFLAGIDQLVRTGLAEGLKDETRILYISPLKALSNDIHRNLEQPLEGIGRILLELGHPEIFIRSMVRTGDTPAAQRVAMSKKPPHILVTTPESLYILLTSDSGRRMLGSVRTVIVDEIHAVAGSKRGAHLALSLERLELLTKSPPTRIGLSATQHPIESIARFLLGGDRDLSECSIIDTGHRRRLDLAIELPDSPLEALLSGQAAGEIHDRLAELINQHRTTLVFVNTRRMAERVARHLSERLDPDTITSHHGSLAREQRLNAETRLKSGSLRALIATASLELGIDIGDVDLVCQIGTTGSISTLLQRVGRSGHSSAGKPKGRLFPTSRDELIECIALVDAVRRGELDRLNIPAGPLDVLAQQLVAMVSCEEWDEDGLFRAVLRASPYHDLDRQDFDRTARMLSEGFSTRLGQRSAYLHHDTVHRKLRPRKSARLTAITCGGAIPDNADYKVILDPQGQFIGTVDEDFAMESLTGDIFQLGNSSWRVLRMESGDLHVEDAGHLPPSIPFWFGEAPGRTRELSFAVSRLRQEIADLCGCRDDGQDKALAWLLEEVGIDRKSAGQAVNYLSAAKAALAAMPSFDTLVLERFFDESGGMQLILHIPYGNRINRAWGLALRKRFCRTFNFELQAAASENAIILSLGTAQSFELESVARYLHSTTVRDILIQALLDAPMFNVRWRWNCTSALAIRRFQGGKKTPPYLVRMQSDDLIASVFPEQMACLENLSGDRAIPEHPLVHQTIHDCLTEAMDIEGLMDILRRIESGSLRVVARDVVEPSPLAAEILNARNYAFLDGAPAEERRTRAVLSRRWLDPQTASDLGQLDRAAIEKVREEAWPSADSADELHEALSLLAFVVEDRETLPHWPALFEELIVQKRAARVRVPNNAHVFWTAIERLPLLTALYPDLQNAPAEPHPAVEDRCSALTAILRARLENSGPVRSESLSRILNIEASEIERCLIRLETEGFLLRGRFTPGGTDQEWCERRLLARIHRYTLKRLRKAIEPVNAGDFLRFLFRWQHLDPDHRMQGNEAFGAIIAQLEGFEAAAGAWESEILPARIAQYSPDGLDNLCMSGRILWLRLSLPGSGTSPIKSTPIGFIARQHLPLWRMMRPGSDVSMPSGISRRIIGSLLARGASFYDELADETGLLPSQLEAALAELVARGLVTSDKFGGLRALLIPEHKRRGRLAPLFGLQDAGRWALVDPGLRARSEPSRDHQPPQTAAVPNAGLLEELALIFLRRYGILFRQILAREPLTPPWGDLLPVLRRMEACGRLRGGRFVAGQNGEQFALPEALESLRKIPKARDPSEWITINASDPLNLLGIVLPGPRISAHPHHRIVFQSGIPVAYRAGRETQFLQAVNEPDQWEIKQRLIRNTRSPLLRSYVGS